MNGLLDYLYKNQGAFSETQLARLSNARVAVGGLGAYGQGALGLAQLGIGSGPRGLLRIADPDTFERHNANRQADATISHQGLNKTDVMAARLLDLVPELHLETFREGVTLSNLDHFLDDIDILVDAVDFLAPQVKFAMHRRARERGIPVATGLLVNRGAVGYFFTPQGPTFEEFFAFPEDEELRRTWMMPGSRIVAWPTHFPYEGVTRGTAERHVFEVQNRQRHITSNPLAAGALTLMVNHMVTAWLCGERVASIPTMLYLDPTTLSMGTVDLAEALREQRESIWTRMAPVYDRVLLPPPGQSNVYSEVVERMAADLAGCPQILEAGCGTGIIAERLARGGAEVTGIDRNLAMLAHAMRRQAAVQAGRMLIGEGDVEALFFDDASFDGYVSNNVVFEADLERALSEAWRVLRPGGRLVVNSFMSRPDLSVLPSRERLISLGLQERVASQYVACQTELLEGGGLRTHALPDVLECLRACGFSRLEKAETSYNGANFYVVARK